jgi:hypothetical protein
MDLDEILYGHYAIYDNLKIVHFNFQKLAITTWQANKLTGWGQQ